MAKDKKEIKFKYIFPDNYNPVYTNGAFGGLTSRNEIVANFFVERLPIPNETIHVVNDNGTLGEMVKTDPDDYDNTVIRYISTGVILNEENARALYIWLGNILKTIDNKVSHINTGTESDDHE